MRLSFAQVMDIALGGTILGTGGGGSFETAEKLANSLLRRKSVRLVHPRDLPDASRVVAIAGMGSPEAMLKTPFTTEARNAFDAISRALPQRPSFVLPLETSGFNFLTPMTVAVSRSVAVVDADAAGRAIPRLNQTLPYARGVSLSPMALADAGDRSAVIRATEYDLSERLALTALESFDWSAGLACYPMNGRQVRRSTVPGTVSLAGEVGRAIREAEGDDPMRAVLRVTGGDELIRGIVDRFETEAAGSYEFGMLDIRGSGADAGATVRVKSMNENMLAWKDGRVVAMAPDRICFMRPDGAPITNADVRAGDEVHAFVAEAQRPWRHRETAALFAETLTQMGHRGPYVSSRVLIRNT
jgi:hypothetical protein